MALTESLEDYLEAVFELDRSLRVVRVRDVAQRLGVTMPSVHGAMKTLEAKGLISHARYEYIELTPQGQTQAAAIAGRHTMIRTFLTEVLGVDSETADRDACRIEHDLSGETIAGMKRYMDHRVSR